MTNFYRISTLFFLLILSGHAGELKELYLSTQLIVVTTPDWNAADGKLQRYERVLPKGDWKPVGEPISIVVGKNGLGWGSGIFSADALRVAGSDDPIKKEGDGKAPAGVFRLGTAFGYAPEILWAWKMPYLKLTESVECVDDTASRFYNRIVYRTSVKPDWNSSEHMLRNDELYRWGIVVEHNAQRVPGKGSCIFLHIWRGSGQGTVGCTAMPREQLELLLSWLNRAKDPLLLQVPNAEYIRLKGRFNLP